MCILTGSVNDPILVPVFVSWTDGAKQAACYKHSDSNQDCDSNADAYIDPASETQHDVLVTRT
jgi:hypothetical protein